MRAGGTCCCCCSLLERETAVAVEIRVLINTSVVPVLHRRLNQCWIVHRCPPSAVSSSLTKQYSPTTTGRQVEWRTRRSSRVVARRGWSTGILQHWCLLINMESPNSSNSRPAAAAAAPNSPRSTCCAPHNHRQGVLNARGTRAHRRELELCCWLLR